jgi:phage terminase small subunit
LVGRDSSGTSSNLPSNIGRQGQSPSNFPTPPSGGRPVYVPQYRTAPKVADPVLGAAANPAGAGNEGGAAEFDDHPKKKKEQSSEQCTHHEDYTQNSKKKKKRNHHLNQQIEVNGENFQFERDQIEKKAPSHGSDFGLKPEYNSDGSIILNRKTGKPMVKQNKDNYKQFTDNLSEFAKDPKSEKIEPQYRKGRENEQDTVGFLNRRDRRFIIFNRHTKKYITGWVMNDLQYQEFINNNNII